MNGDLVFERVFLRLCRVYGAKRHGSPAWMAASRNTAAILGHVQSIESRRLWALSSMPDLCL